MNVIHILSMQPWVNRLGETLVHFLWQGTAIAAVYGVARRSARNAAAQQRYLLACAALATMLITPVITFALLGSRDSTASPVHLNAPVRAADSGTTFPVTAGENASWIPSLSTNATAWTVQVLPAVVVLWFAGAMILSVRLTGAWLTSARWRRDRARTAPGEWQRTLDGLRTRLRISRPVRLLVSAMVEAPVVIGWLRPVILVPAGALAGLPAEHLEALLLHELAHIRRHDFLVNILQSIAEAQLFYHPAVWWISGHIRAERELCCDDLAVAATGDAITYAIALADMEACRPVHAHHALAANGGKLADRIARLLGGSRRSSIPTSRADSVASLAAGAVLLCITALISGQSTERPKFEVASVKPTASKGRNVAAMNPRPSGVLHAENITVRMLIMQAYHLQDFQIVGGGNWLGDEGFDIEAKGDVTANREQMMLMLQSLLEERFQLKYHRETREVPTFALTVAKSGSKLPPPRREAA